MIPTKTLAICLFLTIIIIDCCHGKPTLRKQQRSRRRRSTDDSFFTSLDIAKSSVNNAAFSNQQRNELTNELNQLKDDYQSISKKTNDRLKTAIRKTQVRDMLIATNTAMNKFAKGDVLNIVAGFYDMAGGLAMAVGGPYGFAFAFFTSILSTVLGLINPANMKNDPGAVIRNALGEDYDIQLKDSVKGTLYTFASYKAELDAYRGKGKTPSVDTLETMLSTITFGKEMAFMGELRDRIKNVTGDAAEGKRVYELTALYADLCIMMDTLLVDMYIILNRSEKFPSFQKTVLARRENLIKTARESFDLLRLLTPNEDDPYTKRFVLAEHYPVGHSNTSQKLEKFMNIFGVPKLLNLTFNFSTPYLLYPEKYDSYSLCGRGLFHAGQWKTGSCYIEEDDSQNYHTKIIQAKDGFVKFEMHYKKEGLYDSELSVNEVGGEPRIRTDHPKGYEERTLFRLVPMNRGCTKFLISSKISSTFFVYISSEIDGEARVSENPTKKGVWSVKVKNTKK